MKSGPFYGKIGKHQANEVYLKTKPDEDFSMNEWAKSHKADQEIQATFDSIIDFVPNVKLGIDLRCSYDATLAIHGEGVVIDVHTSSGTSSCTYITLQVVGQLHYVREDVVGDKDQNPNKLPTSEPLQMVTDNNGWQDTQTIPLATTTFITAAINMAINATTPTSHLNVNESAWNVKVTKPKKPKPPKQDPPPSFGEPDRKINL